MNNKRISKILILSMILNTVTFGKSLKAVEMDDVKPEIETNQIEIKEENIEKTKEERNEENTILEEDELVDIEETQIKTELNDMNDEKSEEIFPDINFRKAIIHAYGLSGNKENLFHISKEDIEIIDKKDDTDLKFSGKDKKEEDKIKDVTGIDYLKFQSIDLSHNNIEKFYYSDLKQSNTYKIDIRNNPLEEFHLELIGYTNFINIHLENTNLKDLNDESKFKLDISEIIKVNIYLGNVDRSEIELDFSNKKIYNNTNLDSIYLNDNNLSDINKFKINLENSDYKYLEELSLENNNFKELPKFNKMLYAKKINLNNNNFKKLNLDEFYEERDKTYITLEGNKLLNYIDNNNFDFGFVQLKEGSVDANPREEDNQYNQYIFDLEDELNHDEKNSAIELIKKLKSLDKSLSKQEIKEELGEDKYSKIEKNYNDQALLFKYNEYKKRYEVEKSDFIEHFEKFGYELEDSDWNKYTFENLIKSNPIFEKENDIIFIPEKKLIKGIWITRYEDNKLNDINFLTLKYEGRETESGYGTQDPKFENDLKIFIPIKVEEVIELQGKEVTYNVNDKFEELKVIEKATINGIDSKEKVKIKYPEEITKENITNKSGEYKLELELNGKYAEAIVKVKDQIELDVKNANYKVNEKITKDILRADIIKIATINGQDSKEKVEIKFIDENINIDNLTEKEGLYEVELKLGNIIKIAKIRIEAKNSVDDIEVSDNSNNNNSSSKKKKTSKQTEEKIVVEKVMNFKNHYAYIFGYEDNTVRPNENLTREEASAILDRVTPNKAMTKKVFIYPDVEDSRWSYTNINNLSNKGAIKGYPDGKFLPLSYITRAEAATILVRLEDVKVEDLDNVLKELDGHWASRELTMAVNKGWLKGYEDGLLYPDREITRAEFITLVNRILDRKVMEENILDGIKDFDDLKKTDWYYLDIIEATNSHTYDESRNLDGSEIWKNLIND